MKLMKNPLVSIIVTTFNRPIELEECLDSIFSQTFQNFEVILIDNYSKYELNEMFIKYPLEKLRFFQNDNKGIIAINRNYGIHRARGEYIAFCDDDDMWDINKLAHQLKLIQQTNSEICYTAIREFNDKKNFRVRRYSDIVGLSLLRKNQICLSSVLAKNTSTLFFNENPNRLAIEDYDLWLNFLFLKKKFVYLAKPLVWFRLNPDSTSTKKRFIVEKNKISLFLYLIRKAFRMKSLSILIIVLSRLAKSALKLIYFINK
jgi:teichuronic acid biosynthesis glycosyltransferase TuaG